MTGSLGLVGGFTTARELRKEKYRDRLNKQDKCSLKEPAITKTSNGLPQEVKIRLAENNNIDKTDPTAQRIRCFKKP